MKQRNELEPTIDVAEKLYPQVIELLSEYNESGDSVEIEKIIHKLCLVTGKEITEHNLFEYWEEMGSQELAFKLSLPYPEKVKKITKDEILEIVRRVVHFDTEGLSDFFTNQNIPIAWVLNDCYYIPLLEKNFDCPNVEDLFSRQIVDGKYIEYTVEEIVDKIATFEK